MDQKDASPKSRPSRSRFSEGNEPTVRGSSQPRISIASNMRGFSLNAGVDEDELFDDGVSILPPAINKNAPASNASLSYFDLQRQTGITSPAIRPMEVSEYQQIRIETSVDDGVQPEVRDFLKTAVDMRRSYILPKNDADPIPYTSPTVESVDDHYLSSEIPPKADYSYRMQDGVVKCWPDAEGESAAFHVLTVDEFYRDLTTIITAAFHGPTKSFCFSRLKILESRFKLHLLLNQKEEMEAQKSVAHRDFYNVRKVDNHVHHSACMNQKHLLRFMKKKIKTEGSTIATVRDGHALTLREVFDSLNLTAYDLNIDSLDMHAHQDTMHRFDKFNLKYNPIGESRLREIFLKTDNYMKGRFLAEMTGEVFADLEANKYQFAEYRLSIYGRNQAEWGRLADWVCTHRLASPNVRWMIQIPRLYNVYKKIGLVSSFQDVIDNVFLPLFEVTINPASNPNLHHFLQLVVGFDTVDDESLREQPFYTDTPLPEEWTKQENPLYSSWSYYLYANLQTLNQLRQQRGMNKFSFRPHAGEAGDIDHVATAFLLADSIAHGLLLRKSPVLQYLFYLTQIGVSMSPLSNNLLFVQYERNPFVKFFARGLNVTLSTDDPLLIHFTKEPLLEEYSVAAQVWKLSSVDMCEIARNSVLQSGFEARYKRHWLGDNYEKPGAEGNSIKFTNVPDIRVSFRRNIFDEEVDYIWGDAPLKTGDI